MKSVIILLIISLILQSCTIYKYQNITMDEAVAAYQKVRIIKKDKTKLRFEKIENKDDLYYGITKGPDGKSSEILLDKNDIKSVEILEKDESASAMATFGVVVLSLGIAIYGLMLIAVNETENALGF